MSYFTVNKTQNLRWEGTGGEHITIDQGVPSNICEFYKGVAGKSTTDKAPNQLQVTMVDAGENSWVRDTEWVDNSGATMGILKEP